jgi:hypothetical protein
MQISIEGSRSSSDDWFRAQQLPASDLPQLSDEEKCAAEKLGISAEDYARSAKAGELSRRELAAKTETFGRLLETKMRQSFPGSSVESIVRKTFDGRFLVTAVVNGREVRLRIDEEMIDDLLQSGSPEAERRLDKILELSLPNAEAARAS